MKTIRSIAERGHIVSPISTIEAYNDFLDRRRRIRSGAGFEPLFIPDFLKDFQKVLVDWSVRQGRAGMFQDCGLGKTVQQLVWSENVVRHTNKPVLLATPLAVGFQTVREAEKFGIDAERSRDGTISGRPCVVVTNYEQLHKFNPNDFGGFAGDESSCIKDFKSNRKAVVIEFTRQMKYRTLWTATAAPNDVWELGTSAEALGFMGFRDMITTFFKQETSKDHLGWGRTKYRFRGHAEEPFWKWVCSWSRAIRKPSDVGGDDSEFVLPELHEHEHIVDTAKARDGMLFSLPATNLQEQRQERRNSIPERCEKACELAVAHDGPSVLWCELNAEADRLVSVVPDAVQVSGSMSDDEKEDRLTAFANGEIQRLVTKPKVGCWGLNWQHCRNVISFPSHSYEQYYQKVRRCWRFGQIMPVHVHVIVNEGEVDVLKSIKRKAKQADEMFSSIVRHMNDAQALASDETFGQNEEVPSWL